MKTMLPSSLLYFGILFRGIVLLRGVQSFALASDRGNTVVPSSLSSSSPQTMLLPSPIRHQPRIFSSRRCDVTLQLSTNNDDNAKPKIRFSGIDLDRDQTSRRSPVDLFFSGLTSDVASIALGTVGLLILLVGRLILDSPASGEEAVSAEALGEATRVNLLAVFACGAILLNGVSKLDIQSAMAERVQLLGIRQADPILLGSELFANVPTAKWVLESLLTASPASSVVLLQTERSEEDASPWQIKGYAGVVPDFLVNEGQTESPLDDTPILDRLRRATTESYLPTLQALPGRFEFTSYLPSNTQAVLLLPVVDVGNGRRAAVVLGANQARSFTPRDIAWCQVVANRLTEQE